MNMLAYVSTHASCTHHGRFFLRHFAKSAKLHLGSFSLSLKIEIGGIFDDS